MALASINVVGGYLVTDRMLGMFKKTKIRSTQVNDIVTVINLAYVVAAALFILALNYLAILIRRKKVTLYRLLVCW